MSSITRALSLDSFKRADAGTACDERGTIPQELVIQWLEGMKESLFVADKAALLKRVQEKLDLHFESSFYNAVTTLFENSGNVPVTEKSFRLLEGFLDQKTCFEEFKLLLKHWHLAFQEALSHCEDEKKREILNTFLGMYQGSLGGLQKTTRLTLLRFFLCGIDPTGGQTMDRMGDRRIGTYAQVIRDRRGMSTILDLPDLGSFSSEMMSGLEGCSHASSSDGAKRDLNKEIFPLMKKEKRSFQEGALLQEALRDVAIDLTRFFRSEIAQLPRDELFAYEILEQGEESIKKHINSYFKSVNDTLQSVCQIFLDPMQDIQSQKKQAPFFDALITLIEELHAQGNFLCLGYFCEEMHQKAYDEDLQRPSLQSLLAHMHNSSSEGVQNMLKSMGGYLECEAQWRKDHPSGTVIPAAPYYRGLIVQDQSNKNHPVPRKIRLMEQLALRVEECVCQEALDKSDQDRFKTTIIQELHKRKEVKASKPFESKQTDGLHRSQTHFFRSGLRKSLRKVRNSLYKRENS